VTEITQRIAVIGGDKNDVPTFSAITTGWTATWNEFLASKRDSSVSTVTGGNLNFGFINKHILKRKTPQMGR